MFAKVQEKVMRIQYEKGDNSGSSLAAIIINHEIIMAANAGCSQVVCQTKSGSFLTLSHPHTTRN